MDTTYDKSSEFLSEMVYGRVEFLPYGQTWSKLRVKNLMDAFEKILFSIGNSNFRVGFISGALQIRLCRAHEGGIYIENDTSERYEIRANIDNPFNGWWMDPGINGDIHQWRSWSDNTNRLVQSESGYNIVGFHTRRKIPRVLYMALIYAIIHENNMNRIITNDHPSFDLVIWEAITKTITEDEVDIKRKYSKDCIDSYFIKNNIKR